MIGLSRLIQRIIENPKLLIAVVVLIAFGVYIDYAVLGTPGNPLPEADSVQSVSFFPGHIRPGLPGRGLDITVYRELRGSLAGCEQVIHTGTGELTGTIHIQRTDGTAFRAVLYDWGVVQTDDGLFVGADSEQINRLSSVIRRIGGQGSFALR
ncbi:MAG: hypothetical protein ISS69_17895 [Phycisphaerae bacterium]|nr:hypothetical protein [Phycisphaerae bacterium]